MLNQACAPAVSQPRLTRLLCVFLLALAHLTATLAAAQNILPGAPWNDSSGNFIKAHGGTVLSVNGTYFWIGEIKNSSGGYVGFNCYSSPNLVDWQFVNNVLPVQPSGDLATANGAFRPKVLFNASTGKYVMWMVVNSPTVGNSVGYTTSSTVCGNYTYLGASKPLGNSSFDIGSFQDTDGTAYLLSANYYHGIIAYKMASDYLSASSIVDDKSTWGDREAPAMFKSGGTYFLICSYQSGWTANDNQYSSAPSISGPWTPLKNIAPSGTDTWTSQSGFVLPVTGTQGTTFIYMGDRWRRSTIDQSSYIWLPINVSGTTLSLPWVNTWSVNQSTGTWANNSFGYLHKSTFNALVNMNSGLCLDGASTAQGTVAQAANCGPGTLQRWNVTSQGSNYTIGSQLTGFLLEGKDNTTTAGAPVDSSPADGGTNQQWLFTNVGNGNYTVRNIYSGLCLGVKGAALLSGSAIDEGTCNRSDTNQMWFQR